MPRSHSGNQPNSNHSLAKRIWHVIRYLDHCPVQLPWFDFKGQDPVSEVHRLAAQIEWPATPVSVCFFAVIWPGWALIRVLCSLLINGPRVKRACGIGIFRQFVQMSRLAMRLNTTTTSYYRYRLWRAKDDDEIRQYFQPYEISQIVHWLEAEEIANVMLDKEYFFKKVTALSLPTIPVLAVFRPGSREIWHTAKQALPEGDLFIKRADLWNGVGAECWRWHAEGTRWRRQGKSLTESELLSYCRTQAEDGAVLLQPNQRNHELLSGYSGGGLCTLRVLTCKLPGHEPEAVASVWRMPVGDAVIDNFSGGGIASGLTAEGNLLIAVKKDPTESEFDRHPDTGQQITGTPLPMWRDMVDLALKAHNQFERPYLIGWDIACTPDGCRIVEGNWLWGTDAIQIPHGQPAGNMGIAELILAAFRANKQSRAQADSKSQTPEQEGGACP